MSQSARYHQTPTTDDDTTVNFSRPQVHNPYGSGGSGDNGGFPATAHGIRYDPLDNNSDEIRTSTQKPPLITHNTSNSSSSWSNNITRTVDSLRPSRHTGEWRPKAFSYAYFTLNLLFVGGILLAAILILRRNDERGYIFLPPDGSVENLPALQNFAYQYLPTLVGVLYGTIWTVIWHEVQRMEPWYQMSKSGGASLDDSLGLNYKGVNPMWTPVKAFKKRHWAVFCGSLTFLLSSFGLTPLLGAGFAVRTVTITRAETFTINDKFLPMARQALVSSEFLYDAYDTVWLNASLPEYTTHEYGIAPFKLSDEKARIGDIPVFKAHTTIYTSDVDCKTAFQQPKKNESDRWEFHDFEHPDKKKNCTAGSWITEQFGYFRATWCDNHNIFGGNWSSEDYGRGGVVFCDVDYSSAPATAYYAPTNKTVIKIENIGKWKKLDDKVFNKTSYNNWIGGIVNADKEFPIGWFPSGKMRLEDYSPGGSKFYAWVTPVISQGMGLKRPMIKDLTKGGYIDMITAGHKSIFAHAIPFLLDKGDSEQSPTTVRGTQSQTGEAVVAVRAIFIIVQIIAGLVIVLMICLMISVKRRKNNLRQEPASIGALMSLVARSAGLRESFGGLDEADDSELSRLLPRGQYRLGHWESKSGSVYKLDLDSTPTTYSEISEARKDEKATPNELPFILRPVAAFLVILFFLAMVALVAVFYALSERNNGLPLISKTLFWEQLVYSYIPIGLAQLFSMLWGEFCDTLAVLQPWLSMAAGPTHPSSSLSVKYTAVPPSLLLPRTIAGGHYFLALGSIMPWVSYILPVAAGALFNRRTTTVTTSVPLTRTIKPEFEVAWRENFSGFSLNTANGRPNKNSIDGTLEYQEGPRVYDNRIKDMYAGSLFDQYDGLRATFTRQVQPAWTSRDIYFVPFSFVNNGNQRWNGTRDTLKGRTTGFSAELKCEELKEGSRFNPKINVTMYDADPKTSSRGSMLEYSVNFIAPIPQFDVGKVNSNGKMKDTKIIAGYQYDWSGAGSDSLSGGTGGLSTRIVWNILGKTALELEPLMVADIPTPKGAGNSSGPALGDNTFRQSMQYAQALLVAGWARLDPDNNNSIDIKWVACTQQISAADYDITLDPSAKVLSYNRVTSKQPANKHFVNDAEMYRFQSSTANLFQNSTSGIQPRNTSLPNSWKTLLTGYIADDLNVTGFLDPQVPLKDTETLVRVYNETYARIMPIIFAQNAGGLLKRASDSVRVANTRISPLPPSQRNSNLIDGRADILTPVQRVFASSGIAYALLAMLALNIIVAVAIYGFGIKVGNFRGMKMRSPQTVGMLIARVYDSDALKDVEGTEGMTTDEREAVLGEKGVMYSYGGSGWRGGGGGGGEVEYGGVEGEMGRRVQVERHALRRE